MDKQPYVERPGQAHYNLHQQQQYTQQPVYSDPNYPSQYARQQQQYQSQPHMVYVQPPQQRRSNDESSCLACACLAACCWATFCWPCLCCL